MKRLVAIALVLLTADASARSVWINATRVTRTATTASVSKAYHALRMSPTTPLYYCDYTKGSLCGIEDWYWRESPAYTYRNASNHLTYGPNNLVLRSADMAADPFTSSRVQNIEVDANSNYILRCGGGGSIAYSGVGLTPSSLTCSPDEVLLSPTSSGDLTLTPTGTTTNVRLVKVLAETTFAARNGVDDVNTGSQPYFGPRVDGNGWLVEGAGNSNRALYSNAFDNAVYTKQNTTFTAAAATSPDGSNNAWTMAASSTFQRVRQAINGNSAGSNASYTVALRVKYNTAKWLRLCLTNVAGNSSCRYFDLQNGVAGTVTSGCQTGPCSATMEADPYGNGWYVARFTASISARSDETNCAFSACVTADIGLSNSENSSTITNGHSAYVYGFQVGRDTGRTSYLPTNGQSAFNYGEVADMSDARIAQARAIVIETTYPGLIPSEDDYAILGVNNRGPFGQGVGLSSSGNLNTTWNPDNGMFGSSIVLATTNAAAPGLNRFGVAYDGGHIALSMNGGDTVRRAQTTPIPAVFTLASTQIFKNGNSGSPDYPVARCNCYVRKLALYQDLTDAQLKAKTTIGAMP